MARGRQVFIRSLGVLALLSLARAATATTVVVLLRGDVLCVAADSRVRNQAERGEDIVTDDACKIEQIGDRYFAITGVRQLGAIPGQQDVDLGDIALAAVGKAERRPLDAAADTVAAAVRENLVAAAPRALQLIPGARANLLSDTYAVSLTLAGLQDGRPGVEIRLLYLQQEEGGHLAARVEALSFRPVADPTTTVGRVLGYWSAASKYLRENQQALSARPLEQVAEAAVAVEAERIPAWVGGPVDILRIAPSGAEWLRRKASCAGTPVPPTSSSAHGTSLPVRQ